MTLISSLLFILSTVGVLGFACWDNDLEIPFFYSFGQFEAHWWFNDKLKPGKPHLEQHDKDGPPLVARTGTGGAIVFPYPSGGIVNLAGPQARYVGSFTSTYDDSVKISSKFTPVNGLYGVSNQKENDRTLSVEYYPNASDPSDYIVNRLIGPQADWSELEDMGDKLKLYNTKVFKDGTPFKSARIGGPGNQNDKLWVEMNNYQSSFPSEVFMPPLTSTGAGMVYDYPQTNGGDAYPRSVNDYSGAEYSGGDPDFANSLEQKNVMGYRAPSVYQEDRNAMAFDKDQPLISAWPGEVQSAWGPGSSGYSLKAAFHDSQFDGADIKPYDTPTYGWGVKGMTTAAAGGYYPTAIQKDYIVTQLAQDNPIASIQPSKPEGMGTGPVIPISN